MNEQNDTYPTNFLQGGGQVAELIKSFDWSKTSLGPLQSWPQSLKTSVSIVLQSPVPLVMLWGNDGIMIYNDAYAVFAGARHPFLLGSKVVEGWPEVADFNRNVMRVGLQGKTLSYQGQQLTLFRNNVAEQVWMDLNYSPILDESGMPAGVLAIVVETTQRVLAEQKQKHAEEALQEREEHFRVFVTATSDVIYRMSPDWSEIYFVDGGNFLADGKEPMKDWVQKYQHPQDQTQVMEVIEEAKRTKSTFQLEHRVMAKDGSIRWVSSRAIPILDVDGEITEWFGAASDVTERKRVEEALKESEERFRAIADDAPVFLFLAGENAEVEYLNKTWRDYTGVSTENFKGRAWAEITHPDDVGPATNIYMEGFTQRKSCTFENRQKGTDGIYRTILWKATPRFSPNGQFIGMMGVGLDINERKEAEKELESKNAQLIRINNDLDNFIYTASHDLKAPISNIEGLVNALNKKIPIAVKESIGINPLIEMMYKSVDRFKHTIVDLTEVAKIGSNEEEVAEISFKEILEEVKVHIQMLIDASSAVILDDFTEAPVVYFSRKNLRSLIYNLLSNGIKYCSPERTTQLLLTSSRPKKDEILLTVQDNGLGIKEQDQSKVFAMFKRLHNHVEGTGIGLSIVKRIVDNNGGRIEIESEVGKGSLFKIFLKI